MLIFNEVFFPFVVNRIRQKHKKKHLAMVALKTRSVVLKSGKTAVPGIIVQYGHTVRQVFFKEIVRNPVWICRDPISLILGTRFSLILGTR